MSEGASTSTATFKYDALGRRTERVVDNGTTVQRTQFVYDGIQAIGELVDGRLSATVLAGLNIDEVIARTVNLAGGSPIDTKSYFTDALGSVLAMTNPAQNPELFYAYSAHGETSQLGADVNLPANSNQYTARENDGAVGGTNGGQLYYYRARYFDPVLKRFVSEDPIGIIGGLNPYAYVAGNPTGYTDPEGELIFLALLPVVGAVAGAGINLAIQMYNISQGTQQCINWGNVAGWAAVGGLAGYAAWGGAIFVTSALTAQELSALALLGLSALARYEGVAQKLPNLPQQGPQQIQRVLQQIRQQSSSATRSANQGASPK